MNKHLLFKFILLAFLGMLQSAQAAVLTIKMPGNSTNYTTSVGSFFDANIYINTVADFGGFDFNVEYDSAKLSAINFTSANIFGETETDASFTSFTPGTGSMNLVEIISFDSILESGLTINVPTLIGTIHFQALDTAINSLVSITTPILSDFIGDSFGGQAQGAFVSIEPAPVPVPASIVFFVPGLLAFFGLNRKKPA